MLTVEKVAYLSRVDIFAGTPEYILAAAARIAEGVEVAEGETFITEGAVEDSMYIIVEGRVRVHSKDQSIIDLGPGDSVGELTVLDPQPRAASVTALTPLFLFRITKNSFDEVMANWPEIAQGVIRALVRRVREQGRLMTGNQD